MIPRLAMSSLGATRLAARYCWPWDHPDLSTGGRGCGVDGRGRVVSLGADRLENIRARRGRMDTGGAGEPGMDGMGVRLCWEGPGAPQVVLFGGQELMAQGILGCVYSLRGVVELDAVVVRLGGCAGWDALDGDGLVETEGDAAACGDAGVVVCGFFGEDGSGCSSASAAKYGTLCFVLAA